MKKYKRAAIALVLSVLMVFALTEQPEGRKSIPHDGPSHRKAVQADSDDAGQ